MTITDTDPNEELLDRFRNMTLAELSAFIKGFKAAFGVEAELQQLAPVTVLDETPAVEEQDEFDLVLESFGLKKIDVIKEVRAVLGLGLKEAKDLVDSAPVRILEKADKEKVTRVKTALEKAGAVVTVR